MKHAERKRALDHKFRCCFCCHVKTGTVIFGVLFALSQLFVLGVMILASIRPDVLLPPANQTSDEIFIFEKPDGSIVESFGPPAHGVQITREQLCASFGFSVLCFIFALTMIYGVAKKVAAFLLPMFAIQVFYFCLSCLSVLTSFTYAPTIKETMRAEGWDQLPVLNRLMCLDQDYLMLLFVACLMLVLSVQAYLIGMVWSCYRYIQCYAASRGEVREYRVDPHSQMLLPPCYEDAIKIPGTGPQQPPVYSTASE